MTDVVELHRDLFLPFVGREFDVLDDSGAPVLRMTLAEAEDKGENPLDPAGRRPFSLLFHEAAGPALAQAVRRLRAPDGAEYTLLMVPLGPGKGDAATVWVYQSVVN